MKTVIIAETYKTPGITEEMKFAGISLLGLQIPTCVCRGNDCALSNFHKNKDSITKQLQGRIFKTAQDMISHTTDISMKAALVDFASELLENSPYELPDVHLPTSELLRWMATIVEGQKLDKTVIAKMSADFTHRMTVRSHLN